MLVGAQTPKLIYQKEKEEQELPQVFCFSMESQDCRVKRGYKASFVCCFFGEEVCGCLKSILSSELESHPLHGFYPFLWLSMFAMFIWCTWTETLSNERKWILVDFDFSFWTKKNFLQKRNSWESFCCSDDFNASEDRQRLRPWHIFLFSGGKHCRKRSPLALFAQKPPLGGKKWENIPFGGLVVSFNSF